MSTTTWEKVREQEKAERTERSAKGLTNGFQVLLKTIGLIAAMALGLAVFRATGLFDAIEPAALKIVIGVAIASWFVFNFLTGFYWKRH